MSDSRTFPDDLLQLQRDVDAARAAVDEYAAAVQAERRAMFPDPEDIVERQTWPAEQDAELNCLRSAYAAAARAKWNHPDYVAVDDSELRKAARGSAPASA